jgi:hypothetical protein
VETHNVFKVLAYKERNNSGGTLINQWNLNAVNNPILTAVSNIKLLTPAGGIYLSQTFIINSS